PCEESTSASRSLWMISSELKRFLGIVQSPRHKSMNFGSGPEISGQLKPLMAGSSGKKVNTTSAISA
ncbi:hypothetical protein, partial [Dyella acidiphila]|uniref:hypothetical protein n=1 Tax=Dyella acidiphila TaxID=2775866 RepID=UPI001CE47BDB